MRYLLQSINYFFPAKGSSFRNWLKIIFLNRTIDLKYYLKVLLVTLLNLIEAPLRFFEWWKLRKTINRTNINKPPIFIIGHWRSGTTYLHNLLTKDPQFGYVTTLQAFFPNSFISKNFFKMITKKSMKETRPGDNVEIDSNSPQEEEFALANLFPFGFYNSLYFPKKILLYYFNY